MNNIKGKRCLRNSCYLTKLSDCLLVKLFSYMDASSLFNLGRTCKRFQSLVNDESFWKYIDTRGPPYTTEKYDYCLKRFHAKTTGFLVRKLKMEIDHPDLFDAIRLADNLTVLALEQTVMNGEKITMKNFPETLKELSLKGSEVSKGQKFFHKSSPRMKNLKVLILDHCVWLDVCCIMSISKYPELEIFSVLGCLTLYDSIPYLSLARFKGFPSLKVMDARVTQLGNELLRVLIDVPSIQAIYLTNGDVSFMLDYYRRKLEIASSSEGIPDRDPVYNGFAKTVYETVNWSKFCNSNNAPDVNDRGLIHCTKYTSPEKMQKLPGSCLYRYPYHPCRCKRYFASRPGPGPSRPSPFTGGWSDSSDSDDNDDDDRTDWFGKPGVLRRSVRFLTGEVAKTRAQPLLKSSNEDVTRPTPEGMMQVSLNSGGQITVEAWSSDSVEPMQEVPLNDNRVMLHEVQVDRSRLRVVHGVPDPLENNNDPPGPGPQNDDPPRGYDVFMSLFLGDRPPSQQRRYVFRKNSARHSTWALESRAVERVNSAERVQRSPGSQRPGPQQPDSQQPGTSRDTADESGQADSMQSQRVLPFSQKRKSSEKSSEDHDVPSKRMKVSEQGESSGYGSGCSRAADSPRSGSSPGPSPILPIPETSETAVQSIRLIMGVAAEIVRLPHRLDKVSASRLPLRHLSLRGFRRITDRCLEYLNGLSLDVLDLTYTGCTEEGIRNYLSYHPECRIVHEKWCTCMPDLGF